MKAIIDLEMQDVREAFRNALMKPSCGWLWLEKNRQKVYPEQGITIFYDGKPILKRLNIDKPIKGLVRGVMAEHTRADGQNKQTTK